MTAHPCDQRAFSPLDPTASWLSHLALALYMFVVANFDVLAQARGIRIEIPTWVIIYLHYKIAMKLPTMLHFTEHVIAYPCCDLSLTMLVKI